MTLKDIKDCFKREFNWQHSISIGKIDNNCEKAICFYHSRKGSAKESTIGGKNNSTFKKMPVTVLLRFGTNANEAQNKAQEIYDFFDERKFLFNEKRVFIISRFNEPIDLGTDEKGIYEHSFEFDFYFEK